MKIQRHNVIGFATFGAGAFTAADVEWHHLNDKLTVYGIVGVILAGLAGGFVAWASFYQRSSPETPSTGSWAVGRIDKTGSTIKTP